MRFYKKEILSNALWLQFCGAKAKFEDCGNDEGIVATDDARVISELDQAAARSIGGVVVIDEAEYTDLKKKCSERGSLSSLVKERQSLSALSLAGLPRSSLNVAAVGHPSTALAQPPLGWDQPVEKPPEISVETSFSRPTTGRFFKKETS